MAIISLGTFFHQPAALICDGKCEKAWGINGRPKIRFDEDEEDDYAFLADGELLDAPIDPGTYEGGHAKPTDRIHNKWCWRECERHTLIGMDEREEIDIDRYRNRVFNMPSRHKQ